MTPLNYRRLRTVALEFLVALGAVAIFIGYWVVLSGGWHDR